MRIKWGNVCQVLRTVPGTPQACFSLSPILIPLYLHKPPLQSNPITIWTCWRFFSSKRVSLKVVSNQFLFCCVFLTTSRMQYFTLLREVSSIQNAGRKKKTGSILSENTWRFSSEPHFNPRFSPFLHQHEGRPFLIQREKKTSNTSFWTIIFLGNFLVENYF